jgi:phosphohistidine phosphatase
MKDASNLRDRSARRPDEAHPVVGQKTLWLLRHAKAMPGGEGLDDFARPLDSRGRKAAMAIGRDLARRGASADLVLCSPSVRTRETLELVSAALDHALATEFERALYLASEEELLDCLAEVDDDIASVMLVGHNPGIAELAMQLARRGDRDALEALHRKFPTGALAELRPARSHWSDLHRGCELLRFVTPKSLES